MCNQNTRPPSQWSTEETALEDLLPDISIDSGKRIIKQDDFRGRIGRTSERYASLYMTMCKLLRI